VRSVTWAGIRIPHCRHRLRLLAPSQLAHFHNDHRGLLGLILRPARPNQLGLETTPRQSLAAHQAPSRHCVPGLADALNLWNLHP